MPNSRVTRGRQSQELAAAWFRKHGWFNAQSRAASLGGVDIMGMLGWAPEVKATAKGDLTGALRQAAKNAQDHETPFVIYRPHGYGPERIGEWLVAIRLSDFTEMMRLADSP